MKRSETTKLYLVQDQKPIAIGLAKGGDIRKTDATGRGYQPMIDGVESAWIEKRGDLVSIQLRFEEGLEREGGLPCGGKG